MKPNDMRDSPALLAEGFADHVVFWARERMEQTGTVFDSRLTRLLHRAAFLASMAVSEGHVCALLADVRTESDDPDLSEMRQMLIDSGVVGTPAEPGAMPLILDDSGRLYLHRYFDYERRLACRLLGKGRAQEPVSDTVRDRLRELFASNEEMLAGRPDWQKIAAALALRNPFTVISGGPGTGKTTTVVNILACLLAQDPGCRIALAAPTGKAAARMLEAIRSRADHLPETIRAVLPTESHTVHRLLGGTPTQGVFRHDANNPLALDVLVVDEASMLDLALAVKLFEAVPQVARIILLGDKDQLAAVESGAVFSELCADPTLSDACIGDLSVLTGIPADCIRPASPAKPTAFRDSVVWFSENFRFRKDSGIGKLAEGIGAGMPAPVLAWLGAQNGDTVSWRNDDAEELSQDTIRIILEGYDDYVAAVRSGHSDPSAIFNAFSRFRVLCAMRNTARGVESLNNAISDRIRAHLGGAASSSAWYPGRPVMIMRNDYTLRLFNGDIGITLPDESGELMVFFPDSETQFRRIAPARLPLHETAFAMTVHKSQGSEFDRVLLVLPAEPNRIVTRELFYTGITRARERVDVVGPSAVIEHAILYPTTRQSGLLDRMREIAAGD